MIAIPNTSQALGGEGCPVADITKRLLKRNIQGHYFRRPPQVRAGSSRTVQERTGTVDTPATQRAGFAFTVHSASPKETTMQLSPDAQFARHDLRLLARAHPDDMALASLVGIMRGQILQYEIAPHEGMLAPAERIRVRLEDHLHEQGYVWPPVTCAHTRLAGSSWSENGKRHTRLRCKDCGATLNQ